MFMTNWISHKGCLQHRPREEAPKLNLTHLWLRLKTCAPEPPSRMQPYLRLPNSRTERRFVYSASICHPSAESRSGTSFVSSRPSPLFFLLQPRMPRSQKAREVLICDDMATYTHVFARRDYALPSLTAPYDGPFVMTTLINERTDVIAIKAPWGSIYGRITASAFYAAVFKSSPALKKDYHYIGSHAQQSSSLGGKCCGI